MPAAPFPSPRSRQRGLFDDATRMKALICAADAVSMASRSVLGSWVTTKQQRLFGPNPRPILVKTKRPRRLQQARPTTGSQPRLCRPRRRRPTTGRLLSRRRRTTPPPRSPTHRPQTGRPPLLAPPPTSTAHQCALLRPWSTSRLARFNRQARAPAGDCLASRLLLPRRSVLLASSARWMLRATRTACSSSRRPPRPA